MLLIDPADAATAIGAQCSGAKPASDTPQLVVILNLITPRVEDALNVDSLARGAFVDRFYLPAMPDEVITADMYAMLRLSNAFIDTTTASVVVSRVDGTEVDQSTIHRVDSKYGMVCLSSWSAGEYLVTYTSGFAPTEPVDPETDPAEDLSKRVLVGVPDWIKGIVVDALVSWYRTQLLNPKIPESVSFGALDAALRRDIYARVYSRYMRPRVGVYFSDGLTDAT